MRRKRRVAWGIAAVALIGLAAVLLWLNPKQPLPGEIVSIELYEGQGPGKVLESLLLGKLDSPDDIKQFQNAYNQGKKRRFSEMNLNQLPDYDVKVTPKKGEPYLLHLWIDEARAVFIKSVMRNGSYAVDPAPYESKPAYTDMKKVLTLFTVK